MKIIIVRLIEFYQRFISPYLPRSCRFYPSCSEYTIQSVKRFGPLRGSIKGLLRVLRCHPFAKGGYDPITRD